MLDRGTSSTNAGALELVGGGEDARLALQCRSATGQLLLEQLQLWQVLLVQLRLGQVLLVQLRLGQVLLGQMRLW